MDVIVVGAGPSGLAAAAVLADHARVVIVDRIPVPGGESGWQSGEVQRMVDGCRRRGVEFRLGATAIRWKPGELLIGEPGKVSTMRAHHLVYAGGIRPGTAVDLGITGDRPAGVIPATVAEHLLATDVPLWRRPVIIGRGRWAARLVPHLRRHGAEVSLVAMDDESALDAVRTIRCHGGIVVTGRERVTSVTVDASDGTIEIDCDAVILAGRPQANRNVDGAVLETSAGVSFVQPTGGDGPAERAAAAAEICRGLTLNSLADPERIAAP
jgi:flavin-dependent dehydrogenase